MIVVTLTLTPVTLVDFAPNKNKKSMVLAEAFARRATASHGKNEEPGTRGNWSAVYVCIYIYIYIYPRLHSPVN